MTGRTPRKAITGRQGGMPPKAPELRTKASVQDRVTAFDAPRLASRRVAALLSERATLLDACRASVKAATWLLAADQGAVRAWLMLAAALDADHSQAAVNRLMPQWVGLTADLGLHAGARARLSIVAEPDSVAAPARRSRFAPPDVV